MAGLSVRSELGGVTTPGQCYITQGTHAPGTRHHTGTDRSQLRVSRASACGEEITRLETVEGVSQEQWRAPVKEPLWSKAAKHRKPLSEASTETTRWDKPPPATIMSLNQDTGAQSSQPVACFVKLRKLVNQTITSTYGGDEGSSMPDKLTKVGTISCLGWVEGDMSDVWSPPQLSRRLLAGCFAGCWLFIHAALICILWLAGLR